MAHQPSSILLVKNKKEEAKAIRVHLKMAKIVLRAMVKESAKMSRSIKTQTKLVERLTARHDEVKAPPAKPKIATAAELGGA